MTDFRTRSVTSHKRPLRAGISYFCHAAHRQAAEMLIWLNGPFGAGKTTLAAALRARQPDILIFDPEEIGYLVKTLVTLPNSGDFQDLPLWRTMTVAALRAVREHYPQDIVVPMTLVRPQYLDEILGSLARDGERVLHVFLSPDEAILRARIAAQIMSDDPTRDEDIRQWRLAQVDRCLAAKEWMPEQTHFMDSGAMQPGVLAEQIMERAREMKAARPA